MPVHEIKYRAYEGELLAPWMRLTAIPRFSLRAVFNKAAGYFLFGTGSLTLIVMIGVLYITTSDAFQTAMKIQDVVIPQAGTFLWWMMQVHLYLSLIVLLILAPGMISPERRHNALAIIYSRPVTRGGYILGKLSGLLVVLSYLTFLQPILLFLMMVAFYPAGNVFHQEFWGGSLVLLAKALFCGFAMMMTMSLLGLACSAATKNKLFASVLFMLIFFGSGAVSAMAGNLFGDDRLYFGIVDTLKDLIDCFVLDKGDRSRFWIIFHLCGWWAACLLFLRSRLKPVEIYKE